MKAFQWVALGIGLGVLGWGSARWVGEPWQKPPHYHANWLIVVDGEVVDLSHSRYMQDVIACAATEQVTPERRVHLHNGEGGVVHIHHTGVTWGHLLMNLGFDSGRDYLFLGDDRRLVNEGDRTTKYVINGFRGDEIANAAIRSGDRLLISYGPESTEDVVAEQFTSVPGDAGEYDSRQDPATCAGGVESGFLERLRRAFWG